MVSAPLVSILMPTHSRVDVIGYAIQSVLDQSFGDFELLVVGDGAPPETADVVAAFGDPRIRYFHFPKGPGFGYANRNRALREARGSLIGFAADDDLLFPDHLEMLIAPLLAGAPIAYGQALWVSTDGIAAPFLTNLEIDDEFNRFMERNNSIPASCFLYRADSLPHRDVWDESVERAADWHLWRRIVRENPPHRPVYCRKPVLFHFNAKWRDSRFAGMVQFRTILEIADSVPWWPAALRIPVPPGSTEQSAYIAMMRSDPQGWPVRIRHACTDVIARLAWDLIQHVRPAYLAQKVRLAESEKALASAVQTLTQAGSSGDAGPAIPA